MEKAREIAKRSSWVQPGDIEIQERVEVMLRVLALTNTNYKATWEALKTLHEEGSYPHLPPSWESFYGRAKAYKAKYPHHYARYANDLDEPRSRRAAAAAGDGLFAAIEATNDAVAASHEALPNIWDRDKAGTAKNLAITASVLQGIGDSAAGKATQRIEVVRKDPAEIYQEFQGLGLDGERVAEAMQASLEQVVDAEVVNEEGPPKGDPSTQLGETNSPTA